MQTRRRAPPKEKAIATILDVLGNPWVAQADWNSPTLRHVSVVVFEYPELPLEADTRRQLPALAEKLAGRSDPTFELGAHNWVDFGESILRALNAKHDVWIYSQPWSAMDVQRWTDVVHELHDKVFRPPPGGPPSGWHRLFLDIRLIPARAKEGST
jgi:hypothetical protein